MTEVEKPAAVSDRGEAPMISDEELAHRRGKAPEWSLEVQYIARIDNAEAALATANERAASAERERDRQKGFAATYQARLVDAAAERDQMADDFARMRDELIAETEAAESRLAAATAVVEAARLVRQEWRERGDGVCGVSLRARLGDALHVYDATLDYPPTSEGP